MAHTLTQWPGFAPPPWKTFAPPLTLMALLSNAFVLLGVSAYWQVVTSELGSLLSATCLILPPL